VGILGPGLDGFPLEVVALLHRRIRRLDVKHCGSFETCDVAVVVDYQVRVQRISGRGMGPAAARLHTMVAVAAEEARHMPAAVAVVGYRTSVAAVFAVGCNIDLGLNWGRFVNLEGMMAAVRCNTLSSLVVGYLVGFGHRMTVGDCSRRLCFVWADCLLLDKTRLELALCILVYSGCPLVDRMKEVLVLCIHLDAVRSHCSQSYFATSVSISKLPHS
jgi:hypothetical protein